ncbi:MAG: cupin domain-containing protein [Candidatus Zixiibacteriota bacterium]|jgi:mannose-6-phosphate isomerase-like protein (cupin superfamily)
MEYSIHTDVKYGPLEVVDARGLAASCAEKWWNQTLCRVNDSVARLAVVEGEFHWHIHEREDEFFFVLEGKLYVDVEERTVELEAGQGVVVPRGVSHRPRAPGRAVLLMFENEAVVATGD